MSKSHGTYDLTVIERFKVAPGPIDWYLPGPTNPQLDTFSAHERLREHIGSCYERYCVRFYQYVPSGITKSSVWLRQLEPYANSRRRLVGTSSIWLHVKVFESSYCSYISGSIKRSDTLSLSVYWLWYFGYSTRRGISPAFWGLGSWGP